MSYRSDQLVRDADGVRRFPNGSRVGRPPRPPISRFNEQFVVDLATGCWLWTPTNRDRHGYGKFFVSRGGEQYAHRFAYSHFIGPIPDGLVLDHLCRVRHCVNPAHMEPVTSEENVRRGRRPKAERTHCNNGHEFDEANTYWARSKGRPNRHRVCRRCHADDMRARRQAA